MNMLDKFCVKAYTERNKWEIGFPIFKEIMQNPLSPYDTNEYFLRVHKEGYGSDWDLPYETEDIKISKPLSICRFTQWYTLGKPIFEWDILEGTMQYNNKELLVIPNLERIASAYPITMEYVKGYKVIGNMHDAENTRHVNEKDKNLFAQYLKEYYPPCEY